MPLVGGKNASIGEMIGSLTRLGVKVPGGYATTAAAYRATLARDGLDLLVIDGGDGTVRDVISLLPHTFGEAPPLLAVLPSGKTNVLAIDLGTPGAWRLEQALAAALTASTGTLSPIPPPTIMVSAWGTISIFKTWCSGMASLSETAAIARVERITM